MLLVAIDKTLTDENDMLEYFPKRIYNQLDHIKKRKLPSYECSLARHVDFPLMDKNVEVRGDVCLCLFSALSSAGTGGRHNTVETSEKMCQLYFNTCFIERNYLVFEKSTIDLAHKDHHNIAFPFDFKIEIFLHCVESNDSLNHFQAPVATLNKRNVDQEIDVSVWEHMLR